MTRMLSIVIALFALLSSANASAALRVVTTTTDLQDFVSRIGAGHVSVESLTKGDQDPHYVQARPSYMVQLSRADLVVAVGLELELGWLPALISGARNPRIRPGEPGYLEAASAITPIEVAAAADRSAGDVHRQGNPHFWLDPLNATKIVPLIAQRLAQLDPPNASVYAQNAQLLRAQLEAALGRWTSAMAPLKGTKIVSYHRTFDYFFERFGLELIGVVEDRPGIPPSPSHAAKLIAQMRQAGTRVLFHEQYHDRKTSDLIASKASATVLVLPTSVGGVPAASSYEKLIDQLVAQFVAAAKRGG